MILRCLHLIAVAVNGKRGTRSLCPHEEMKIGSQKVDVDRKDGPRRVSLSEAIISFCTKTGTSAASWRSREPDPPGFWSWISNGFHPSRCQKFCFRCHLIGFWFVLNECRWVIFVVSTRWRSLIEMGTHHLRASKRGVFVKEKKKKKGTPQDIEECLNLLKKGEGSN